MPSIEVDQRTARALEFAANVAGVSTGEVVARLVNQASLPVPASETPSAAVHRAGSGRIAIHVEYAGHRTNAWFTPATHGVDIEEGPLSGQSFRSPSGAARAVVSRHKPAVDPNRNGWIFWTVTETGGLLQGMR